MSDEKFRPDSQTLQPKKRLSTFESFGIINFRWFFSALVCSFASMNIQMFVRGWLVFEITGSYEKLGWMTAAGGIVGLVAAPLGGVIADRVRQKKYVLQLSGFANAAVTVVMAYFIARGQLSFEHLLVASILQGLIMSAMMPARQAITKDVVGLDRLTNAIALTATGMNGTRLLLPGLAGGMVAALGGGHGNIDPAKWIYVMMTVLYILSAILIMKVKLRDRMDTELSSGPMFEQICAGFNYVLHTPVIFMLLGCNFLMAFFGMTYYMLLPGFVKEVLNAGPDKLGLILSIAGFGSLAGSLVIASLPGRKRAKVLLSGTLLMGIALLLFSISTDYWLSLALLTFVGLGSSARMSLSNVLIQTHVDDDFRGRVMSIHMLEMAVISIGIFPVSIFADVFGPQWAIGLSALCLIVLVLFLFAIPAYRDLD